MDLQFISYNCRGIPKDKTGLALRPDIINVLENCHIAAFQETWLSKQSLNCLNSLHDNFVGSGVAKIDESSGIIQGRFSGGVAFLWRNELSKHIKVLELNVDWCIAIEFSMGSTKFVIFNIYMPYQSPENEDLYMEKLGYIKVFLDELQCTNYAIIGDWNANLGNSGTITFREPMLDFCGENELKISSHILLPTNSYTHIHVYDDNLYNSWLDHVVSSHDFHHSINNISICYDISNEDHIPVKFSLLVNNLPTITDTTNEIYSTIRWDRATKNNRDTYYKNSNTNLGKVKIPIDAACCKNTSCNDQLHRSDLDIFYKDIVNTLHESSKHLATNQPTQQIRPGWSDYVSDLYDFSRETYHLWQDHGKPRQGPIFSIYAQSRRRFKYALRFIKKHENDLWREAIAKKYADNNPNALWSEINKINNSKVPLPTSIEDATGSENITILWKDHYNKLFNCLNNNKVNTHTKYESSSNVQNVTSQEILNAIKKLDINKSCGSDEIYAEHLKYSTEKLYPLLSILFSSLLVHSYLPKSLMTVILVPVIKNKAGNINSLNNYRPIALASILSKVMEYIILDRMEIYMITNDNQFGFKRSHGTDQCIYALKEIANLYTSRKGCIFTCFLDASKAFDRINHSVLFEKLYNRGVPGYLIRILMFWYQNQTMCVKWGSTLSETFTVTNGVRQGGILSPHLFNVYVDDLSNQLNKMNIGCVMGNTIINHLMYADDIVLISPSSAGLKSLLNICEKFGEQNDILFNASKSAIMVFKSKTMPSFNIPHFNLNENNIEIVDNFKYLGHILCNDLSDKLDIERQRRKLYAQGNSLIRKFHMCTLETKLLLFNTYCSSMYTVQLWTSYTCTAIMKLHTAYHNILKSFIGVSRREHTSPICVNLNVKTCQAVIRNFVYKFMCRLKLSNNILIKPLCNTTFILNSPMWRHWRSMLYVHI